MFDQNLVDAWRAKEATTRDLTRHKDAHQAKAMQAKEDAREKARAERQAIRVLARAAVLKAAAATKRAALKEAWPAEKEAAVARGEPFESDDAPKVYMAGKRSADARKAKPSPLPSLPECEVSAAALKRVARKAEKVAAAPKLPESLPAGSADDPSAPWD